MKIDFKSISMVAFCAFAVKCLIIQDISILNAACLLISASFVAFYEMKASVSQLKGHQDQIDELNKKITKLESLNQDIITSLSSVKTSINMKSQSNRSTF